MRRSTLEQLRQPLEEGKILISRLHGRYVYPAEFLLIAAMNPCPCGYYPDRNRCSCAPFEVNRYLNHISQPLLDRIDLAVETTAPSYEEFRNMDTDSLWTSEEMAKQVQRVHIIQKERFKDEVFSFNSKIPAEKIAQYCETSTEAEELLKQAFSQMGLTGRACNKILKIARTIADLDSSELILENHLGEAIGFRGIDKSYWK